MLPRKASSAKEGRLTRPQEKILRLNDLNVAMAQLRSDGLRTVLCHGVFDLLHVGHLRHLRAAKEFGDILVVTITADEFVNKGPDRPAFPGELRAEMLAGLQLVDYVALVHDSSAAPAIEAVKPDFFVKGSEYADPENDITGKIVFERELVRNHGGELVFTDDVTFSSSNLLNRFFAVTDEGARNYLAEVRRTDLRQRLDGIFHKVASLRALIVGETIIDRYIYVDAMAKAAKENIIATRYRDQEEFAGGAIAAANHIAALCPNIELITLLGDARTGDNFERFVREHLDPNVEPNFICRPESPTVQKTRHVEPTYVRKLFETYHMDDRPLPTRQIKAFHDLLREKMREADLVIVCDFGHGFIQKSTVDLLQKEAPFLAVNVQANAGNVGYNLATKYSRADFLCIDTMEARLAVQEKHADPEIIVRDMLPKLIECGNIIITHGKAGCYTNDGNGVSHIPAFTTRIVDTVGAGDAFFVAAAAVVAAGGNCREAGFVGNVAGGLKTGIVGHRSALTKLDIERYITTLLK